MKEGCLTHNILEALWRQYDTAMHMQLRALLCKFELAITDPTQQSMSEDERDLIVPCLAESIPPKNLEKILGENPVVCTYSFGRQASVPQTGFWSQLVVRMTSFTKSDSISIYRHCCAFSFENVWVRIDMSETGVTGVKMQVQRTGHEDWKRMSKLLDEIRQLMAQYHVLTPELFVQCFGCKEEAFRDKFYCKDCQLVRTVKTPLFPDPNSPTIPTPLINAPKKVSEVSIRLRATLAGKIGVNWDKVARALDKDPNEIINNMKKLNPTPTDYAITFNESLANDGETTMRQLAQALKDVGLGIFVTQEYGFEV